MYVITYNNQVILGPMRWNRFRFENTIQEECEVAATLQDRNDAMEPVVVSEDVKILPVQGTPDPVYNSKIQRLHGPFWQFTDVVAISSYTVEDLNIDAVKNTLKAQAAAERWNKENAAATYSLQGTTVTVDTSRDGRNIFVQKFLLMGANDTVTWKFPEGWFDLTKQELGEIVNAGATWIQDQFNWEVAKVREIDNCETLEQLDAIVITEPAVGNRVGMI